MKMKDKLRFSVHIFYNLIATEHMSQLTRTDHPSADSVLMFLAFNRFWSLFRLLSEPLGQFRNKAYLHVGNGD